MPLLESVKPSRQRQCNRKRNNNDPHQEHLYLYYCDPFAYARNYKVVDLILELAMLLITNLGLYKICDI